MGGAPRIRIIDEGLTGDVSQRPVDTDDGKLQRVSRLAQFAQ
jgi:Trp operon repressor